MAATKKNRSAAARQQSQEAIKALRQRLKKPPPPRVSDIGAEFITLAGGPKEFAKLIYSEFIDADKGSTTRQRILDMVGKALRSDDNRFDTEALDDMEEVDLLRLCGTLFDQAGVVTHGDRSATGPAAEGEAEAEGGEDGGGDEGGESPPRIEDEAEAEADEEDLEDGNEEGDDGV